MIHITVQYSFLKRLCYLHYVHLVKIVARESPKCNNEQTLVSQVSVCAVNIMH